MEDEHEIRDIIRQELFSRQDMEYKRFHSRLMPTIKADTIIGVRVPALRQLAKQLEKEHGLQALQPFMRSLPHHYYEENNIHAFLIEKIKDFDECVAALDTFLPFVDNWATCDMMSPKVLAKNLLFLMKKITEWVESPHTYTCRFGIGMLMRFYLEETFEPFYLDMVASIDSQEYYVNMMRAWFFATALAKQWEATLPFIVQNRLDAWTHNKTIQKAIESYRISPEHKAILRALRHDKPQENGKMNTPQHMN